MDKAQNLRGSVEIAALRQCPFCGVPISRKLIQCPACRETLPEIRQTNAIPVVAKRGCDPQIIRRGLLYMLLAAVIHYFAGGYSAMNLPYPVTPIVTVYLSPLLFLSGLGLAFYGLFSRRRIT
jgi:hypothetical protein